MELAIKNNLHYVGSFVESLGFAVKHFTSVENFKQITSALTEYGIAFGKEFSKQQTETKALEDQLRIA